MDGLVKSIAMGVIRNVATAAGGWMVTQGYLQASQTDGWIGSILFLAGIGFTVYDKFAVKGKIQVAHATPPYQPLPSTLQ